MLKTTLSAPSVLISIGWDTKVLVPASKAGALINMLAECKVANEEYNSELSKRVLVTKDAPMEMLLGQFDVVTRADYDVFCAEKRAERDALCAEQRAALRAE
jgi:hypothetical protein